MSEQQNKGICPPHNPTGEWSVRDGKSYATCRNCGEYETSLMEKDTHPLTMEERFIEEGADLEHDRWARWQKYFFSHCQFKPQGEVDGMDDRYVYFALPKDLYEMWVRKIKTPYAELTEQEKESDRKETRNYLPLVSSAVSQALKEKKDTTLKLIDKYYLQYCREQNGLDHCKNCGLNIDELEELLSNNKE